MYKAYIYVYIKAFFKNIIIVFTGMIKGMQKGVKYNMVH